MKKILILGATSAIAIETARLYAQQGCSLFLAARDEQKLITLSKDLIVRGANTVGHCLFDANQFDQHQSVCENALQFLGQLDIVLICHGSLPDQQRCAEDFNEAQLAINTNGLSVISLLSTLAEILSSQGQASIAVITSVAGDRGRPSNYVYGTAKAMVSTYIQGLRGQLFIHNVHITDIKPGFVDSPMTAEFKKGLLWSQPETIAKIILTSIEKKKHTVYAPFYWRFIMLIVTSIPEFIFKRIKL